MIQGFRQGNRRGREKLQESGPEIADLPVLALTEMSGHHTS
jgi:hypothetical protein